MSNDLNKVLTDAFDALGHNDHNMERSRPYTGQPWTSDGERGRTEVKGITFRDLRDAYMRAVILSAGEIVPDALYREAEKGEHAAICAADLFGFDLDRLDPVAIGQNLGVEVEKLMGIFPNLPADWDDDPTMKAIRGEG